VLRPLPRVLVLGAGLDAEPVVRLVRELGWRVVVSDHRPADIQNGDFSMAESAHCTVAAEIDKRFELGKFDAAIVMSHHLVSDETYLRLLAPTSIRYIGLLGPINRRRRLLEQLGKDAAALSGRLHGPAGIDIHASGPASIALSIVAEMHRELIRRD
jgi:xanthine dehydrogenase accessory factor